MVLTKTLSLFSKDRLKNITIVKMYIAAVLIFFVILITLSSAMPLQNFKDQLEALGTIKKLKTRFNGHWSYIKQNFSDYPIDNPLGAGIVLLHAHEFIGMLKEDAIRCIFIEAWPWLFVERDAAGFLIWGPFYSIVVEAARSINYTIKGISIKDEDRHAAFSIFKPDFIISLIWPQLDYVRMVFQEEDSFDLKKFGIERVGWLTKSPGVVETDHILFFSLKRRRPLFSFLKVFDKEVWFLIVVNALAVMITTRRKNIPFKDWCFLTLRTLVSFSCDIQRFRKRISRFQAVLFILWMMACYLLQIFFGGDMFATLAIDPSPLVLNSLTDLEKSSIRIKTVNVEMLDGPVVNKSQTAFIPITAQYKNLADRFEYFPFEEMFNMRLLIENFWVRKSREKQYDACTLAPKPLQSFIRNIYDKGFFRNKLHVSESGGDAQLHIFLRSLTADDKEAQAVDKM